MQLRDVYIRFDRFLAEVLAVEKKQKMEFNMFQAECDNPKNYYIPHYPYTEPAFDRTEFLARLGIMTDAVLTSGMYQYIEETDSVRLMLSTGCAKILPFSSRDDVSFLYIPNSIVSGEFLSQPDIANNIPYTVFANVKYAQENIADCCVPMGGVLYRNIPTFEASVRAQMLSNTCKVIWLKEYNF